MNEFKIDKENSIIYNDSFWSLQKNGAVDKYVPDHLYKYYSLNDYNLDALEQGYFYLNNPLNFNDPFDCCNNLIIEKQRDLIDGFPIPFINDIPDIGVSCFSTKELNPLMWGHYTNSYVGFVLKFKNDFNLQADKRIKSYKFTSVVYSDNPAPASGKYSFSTDYQLMVKLKDWEYESEWRLIVNKTSNDLQKIFYSTHAIEEILIGYRSTWPYKRIEDKQLCERLNDIVTTKYKDIKTFSVGPHEKYFRLNKRRLLINPEFKITAISLK
jgi:hypothetical protein